MLVCIGVTYHRAGLLLEYGMIYRGGGMCIMSLTKGVATHRMALA